MSTQTELAHQIYRCQVERDKLREQNTALLLALKLARGYVAATHNTLVPAVGPNTVVKPDLDQIDAAIAEAQKATGGQ